MSLQEEERRHRGRSDDETIYKSHYMQSIIHYDQAWFIQKLSLTSEDQSM